VSPNEADLENLVVNNPVFKGIHNYLQIQAKEDVPLKKLSFNEFQRLLSMLEGQPNYKVIYDGLGNLLENFVKINDVSLPKSMKEIKCLNEVAIFFLKLVNSNPVLCCKL